MQKNLNPWTGRPKTSKNTGMFNQLIDKHYPELQPQVIPNPYLDYVAVI